LPRRSPNRAPNRSHSRGFPPERGRSSPQVAGAAQCNSGAADRAAGRVCVGDEHCDRVPPVRSRRASASPSVQRDSDRTGGPGGIHSAAQGAALSESTAANSLADAGLRACAMGWHIPAAVSRALQDSAGPSRRRE
jgi:hypothetical protein